MNSRTSPMLTLSEWSVLVLLAVSILWKGGKSLEMTWLLTGVTAFVVFVSLYYAREEEDGKKALLKSVSPFIWAPAMLFALWTIMSYGFSLTRNYGFDEVLRDCSLVLLFLWMVRRPLIEEGRRTFARKVFIVIVVASVLACFLGVAVYLFQPVNRFVGSFFDQRFTTDYWPNAWAEFLLIAWPLLFFFTLKKRGIFPTAVLGFVIGCLLLSYSRGAFLAFVGQITLFGMLGIFRFFSMKSKVKFDSRKFYRTVLKIVLVFLLAALTFLIVNKLRSRLYEVESVAQKATFTAEEGRSSIDERSEFWHQSFALSLEHPFLGSGPYSFRFLQPRFQQEVFATSDHPHNVILKFAMERGWPAAVFFLVLVIVVVIGSLKTSLFKDAASEVGTMESFSAFVAISGVLAHNLLDYNLQFVGIALPFWLLLGFLGASATQSWSSITSEKILRKSEAVLAFALIVAAVIEGVFLFESSMGRRAELRGNVDTALSWYESAKDQQFSRDLHLSRAYLFFQEGKFENAADALHTYFLQNREDARAWKLKGDLDAQKKEWAQAVGSYDEALKRGRYNYFSVLRALLTALHEKRDSQVLTARKAEFDAIVKKFYDAILQNAHFIALSSNVEEFMEGMKLMERLYPADAKSYRDLSTKAEKHALEERTKNSSRPPGYLW